jgi:hypothetical protein
MTWCQALLPQMKKEVRLLFPLPEGREGNPVQFLDPECQMQDVFLSGSIFKQTIC